jgi:hypothetical protein
VKLGLLFVASVALVAVASEAGAAGLREAPAVGHPVKRPPGVPDDYVLTHHGFLHPSCVVSVASGDVVGARSAPCAYPRFTAAGQAVDAEAEADPMHEHSWDGWLVYYQDDGVTRIPVAPALTTEWVVPPTPWLAQGLDVAFFSGITTVDATTGGRDLLQPVLDFGQESGWIITSEHFPGSGHDVQSTWLDVSPGDVIRGVIAGQGCHSDGVCEMWSITTTDVTTGLSTVLNVKGLTGAPRTVNPAVLETYDLSSCDGLPPSGEETFTRNELRDGHGAVQPLNYALHASSATPAGAASCGYRGRSGADWYQLSFSGARTGLENDPFDGTPGCQCVVVGAALPRDWRVAEVLGVMLSLLSVRRLRRRCMTGLG